jgi:hypothetical protein
MVISYNPACFSCCFFSKNTKYTISYWSDDKYHIPSSISSINHTFPSPRQGWRALLQMCSCSREARTLNICLTWEA